jgi:glycosyltransferase involved in cell wall biosynthesis
VSEAPPGLGIVIPTHDRRDLVEGLLQALAAQTVPAASFEVVLVCDGCTDDTAEVAMALVGPGGAAEGLLLSVVEQMRSGAAAARNRGMGATTAPVIVFLDDDMVPEPGCLAAHAATHRAHPGALVLGHMPVHERSPRSFLTVGLARWAERRHDRLSRPGTTPRATDVLTGHLSISRSGFGRVGGFDQDFTAGGTFGGEDIEFGYRAVEAGVPLVYAGDAVAGQVFIKTFRALAQDIREGALADAAVAAKHPEAPHSDDASAAFKFARRFPALAKLVTAPLVALLDRAARRGAVGRDWEALHAWARSLLSGIALSGRPPRP